MEYAAACVQPGLQYYADCKANSMKEPLACFKAARLFFPTKIEEMKLSTSEVDTLVAFPFRSMLNMCSSDFICKDMLAGKSLPESL